MSPQPILTKPAQHRKPTASTGPRTEAGKATSSQNAVKHGLASGLLLIPGEDPAVFAALEQALRDEHQPATPTEELLVGDLAKYHWLKDRAVRLQGEALALAAPGALPAAFPVLLRYQTTNERAFHKALTLLLTLRKEAHQRKDQFVSQQIRDEIARDLFAPRPYLKRRPLLEKHAPSTPAPKAEHPSPHLY